MADPNQLCLRDLRARAALYCAKQSPDKPIYRRIAERDAAYLEKSNRPYGIGWGSAIRGGLAMLRGDRATAVRFYERALETFERCQLRPYSAAVRLRLSSLVPDGKRYEEAARKYGEEEGIGDLARLSGVWIPFV